MGSLKVIQNFGKIREDFDILNVAKTTYFSINLGTIFNAD